jgi:uncharacterized protein (TIGR03663 family)
MPAKLKSLSLSQSLGLFLVALLLGYFYRFPDLRLRPMHLDEAILGIKSLTFWKSGSFDYDPKDYHGPALHYLFGLANWLLGWGADASEAQLRGICAVVGLLLLMVTWGLVDGLGQAAVVVSSLLIAVSPMQVFYSRYYIMEVVFVFELAVFITACWRYIQGNSGLWLIIAGLLLGAMHATKETFVINLLAMVIGWGVMRVVVDDFTPRVYGDRRRNQGAKRAWLWVTVPALLCSTCLYSGLHDWENVKESYTTYGNYLQRSQGAGGHEKPFFYYLQLLSWNKSGPALWTELLVLVLACVGIIQSFLGTFIKQESSQALRVFLSTYALAGLVGYSLIPYKTPWTIMSIEWALILLAGLGAQSLYGKASSFPLRWGLHLVLLAGIYHLCQQSMQSIHYYRADPRNPYVYSHTSPQALKAVARVQQLEAFAKDSFSAQVVSQDQGWPFPWYFRHWTKVGYQSSTPTQLDSAIILMDSSLHEQLPPGALTKEYAIDDFYGLRPGVPMTLLVEKTLYDAERSARLSKTTEK